MGAEPSAIMLVQNKGYARIDLCVVSLNLTDLQNKLLVAHILEVKWCDIRCQLEAFVLEFNFVHRPTLCIIYNA